MEVIEILPKAKVGRPRIEITPEMLDTLARAIELGSSVEATVRALNIGLQTYYDWQDGERYPGEPYDTFRATIERSVGVAIAVAENRVYQEKPLEWLRRHWKQSGWTSAQSVEIAQREPIRVAHAHIHTAIPQRTPKPQTPPLLDYSKLSDAELEQLESIVTKCLAANANDDQE